MIDFTPEGILCIEDDLRALLQVEPFLVEEEPGEVTTEFEWMNSSGKCGLNVDTHLLGFFLTDHEGNSSVYDFTVEGYVALFRNLYDLM